MRLLKYISFRKIKNLILVIAMSLFFSVSQAQISTNEMKATLILHFCENVRWKNKLIDTLKIGCISANEDLYKFLKPAGGKIRIQQKPIQIIKLTNLDNIQGINAIYYGGKSMDKQVELFNFSKQNNVLLITDNIADELFVLINLYNTQENVSFRVNMPNLALAGFEVKPNLLLHGGSVIDINLAYKKFEERLETSKNSLDALEDAYKDTKKELSKKEQLLQDKEKSLAAYTDKIKESENQSQRLQKTLEKERILIENQRNEIKESFNKLKESHNKLNQLKKEIDLKVSESKKLEGNLKILTNKSENLQKEISEKNMTLSEQEVQISAQKKMLLMSISLAVALIIIGITLYRMFRLKKKNNILLEQKVDEKTRELKKSNIHFQALFNLAPVALWETDFSEVKKYINSFGFKNETDYDKYVATHKDFSIECVRRIIFININKTALDLYKIESKDEMLQIYENIHKKGKLIGVLQEFKLLFREQNFHSYETVRLNKLGEPIELITTWVDISEVPGTFNKVLLSLVDITHLRNIEKELKRHQHDLEKLVQEKTMDLEAINEELNSTNEELYKKNNIINKQYTKLKSTLQHLKQTQAQLLQSEKMASLGILTAGVAHEINNPLNYIMGAYEGLKVHVEDEKCCLHNEEVSFLLKALKTGVDRTANIVKSLNQFSRNNQNMTENCNIHEIIDNCLVMIQTRTKNRIEIIKHFSDEALIILGNVGALHQVFLNIFSNAEQSIAEEGTIEIKTIKQSNHISIEISDTGHGISKENLKKITDPFFTTKDPGKGTGLGLSISYNIITDHKGVLEFESEINKGTCARIILPINKDQSEN